MIFQKRDESTKAIVQSFENESGTYELSLFVMQTKKEVVFLVVPTKNYDENLSTQLEKKFPGRDWTQAETFEDFQASNKDDGSKPLEFNKISYLRLGENRKNDSNFSKSSFYRLHPKTLFC